MGKSGMKRVGWGHALVMAALAAATMTAVACGSDAATPAGGEPPDGSTVVPGLDGGTRTTPLDGGDEEDASADDASDGIDAQPAEFGLDTRPANTSCVAPARPPNAAPVKLEAAYDDIMGSAGPKVTAPLTMAQRPGDGSRWFLAERNGRIVSFNATGTAATRDLRDVVTTAQLLALTGKTVNVADESGFHGMVFDPDFATNGRLYVSFSTFCDGNIPLCDDPLNLNGDYYKYAQEIGYLTTANGGASFSGYQRLMHIGRWDIEHYGGSVAFDKDKNLLISSGDGLDDSAVQFNTNYFGKVLRIDVHGAKAPGKNYGIPAGNPFANGAGGKKPEIFAWGFRNPFRLTVDRLSGEIWVGDVGDNSWEEIDRVEVGGNYGWPCREGKSQGHAFNDASKCPSKLGFTEPLYDFPHIAGGNSVTGGYVYRGAAIAGFQGTYVFGDFIQKQMRSLTLEGTTWTSKVLNAASFQDGYVSFAEDAAGEIYSVALFDRKIHKLVQNGPPPVSTFPDLLSKTGCVLPADPSKPAAGVIPFDVNSPLWSDGAAKQRWLAIPDGTTIGVGADGDFTFPIGTVLMKTFSLAGKRIETRLYIRHADGEWGGYSYEWNDAQSDATLLPAGKSKVVGAQTWTFPSRSECGLCHTSAAGRSLGLEIGQLNRSGVYPSTARSANQLKTLDHIGMFTAAIGDPATLSAYPSPTGDAALDTRARAYLHANCAGCHRPSGGGGRSSMDLRFATAFAATNTCNATPIIDDFGSAATRIVKPGTTAQSILSLRVHATDGRRMPPLGRSIVDTAGVGVLDAWIGSLTACP